MSEDGKIKTNNSAANHVFIHYNWLCAVILRYTNADLKNSLYVRVHLKTIPWKFCILNPKNSRVTMNFVFFPKK